MSPRRRGILGAVTTTQMQQVVTGDMRAARVISACCWILVLLAPGCTSRTAHQSPRTALRILADPFAESLVHAIGAGNAHLSVEMRPTSFDGVSSIQRGDVDLALAPASAAYFAVSTSGGDVLRAL